MNKPAKDQKGASLKYTNQSMQYAFHFIDRGHDDILNRILWFSVKGNAPYPAHLAGKDDDDDD